MKIEDRKKHIEMLVQDQLPQLTKMVKKEADVVMMHQDAFAADYQADELLLLGAAIKYIGMSGKEIHIIGDNRETL